MKRFLLNDDGAVYHCMNRTIHGIALLQDREKEMFRQMLWRVADFCGVEVLTYCLMNNHFHILVRVNKPVEGAVSDAELVRRYRVLYPRPTARQPATPEEVAACFERGGAPAETLRRQLLKRMHNLSAFLKILKQRFSIWYNATHERFGTFWADRFKSVIVEPEWPSLLIVAAYIDLNPVRAGIVSDPKDYRFCGYAEAVAGHRVARAGICQVARRSALSDAECMADYRCVLFGKGAAAKRSGEGAVIDAERAREVMEEERGILPETHGLHERVSHFSEGWAIGAEAFLDRLKELRNLFLGYVSPAKADFLAKGWGALKKPRARRGASDGAPPP